MMSVFTTMLDIIGNEESNVEVSCRFFKLSRYDPGSYLKIRIRLFDKGEPVLADFMYISSIVLHNSPDIDSFIVDELYARIKELKRQYEERTISNVVHS